MNLILVRHGEIPSNIKKVYAGRRPEKLNDKGIRQSQDVAKKLLDFRVDAIYTSPIQRAVQTAEIIREKLNVNVVTMTAFRELEMGPWEGMSEIGIARQYPKEWKIWNTRPAELRLSGRETLDELQERVLTGINAVYQNNTDKNIVIITHVAIIRVLLLWHEKKSLNLYKKIHVPNVGVFEFKLDADTGM